MRTLNKESVLKNIQNPMQVIFPPQSVFLDRNYLHVPLITRKLSNYAILIKVMRLFYTQNSKSEISKRIFFLM